MRTVFITWLLALIGGLAAPVFAEHSIDVQRLAAKEQHFEALTVYEKLPRRTITTGATLAAAKSAWALSLPNVAIEEFEKALRSDQLTIDEIARAYLARGIIEYQEERYQISVFYAEKLISLLKTESPLRARAWLLWGDSLYELGAYGASQSKFEKALQEASAK